MKLRDFDVNVNYDDVSTAVRRLSLIQFEKSPPPNISELTKEKIKDHLDADVPAEITWQQYSGNAINDF